MGDRSTAGGTIVEGIEGASNNGRQLSFIGAAVDCPACHSTGRITPSGERWPGLLMGRQAALDGDLCQCKCEPFPRMIAADVSMAQTFESESGGAAMGSATGAAFAVGYGAVSAAGGAAAKVTGADPVASAPLTGGSFTLAPSTDAGDAMQTAARGVSEDDEAECHAQYEEDMDMCNAGRAMFQSPAYYQSCAARAFQRYQTCRGY
ncbi:PAAR domain-containing protein [Paraburkholderia fungorum]|uniref:PAAR domain-containing protein n=1 Tax=Paraburkholderia fungorum TaxID=134537 RepID=UPI003877FEDD